MNEPAGDGEASGRSVPDVAVAIVDAETPGNVGTVARSMKNFGLSELLLVDPPPLEAGGEAYGFAGQAREDVLPDATELSFGELAASYHTIGCTAVPNEDATSHVRYPVVEPADLATKLRGIDAPVAVVFGRESTGLTNDELAELDMVCSIPASATYPVLNLGQAATVVLYELRELTVGETQHPAEIHQRAREPEIERLYDQFGQFLRAIGHPEPKREKTRRLFRRVLGRAEPTPREARTLQGLLRRGTELSPPAEDGGSPEE